MREDQTLKIIDLCVSLEEMASKAFTELSSLSEDDELRTFWREMSEDEERHIAFWQRLREMAEERSLPQLLENPDQTLAELEKIKERTTDLMDRFSRSRSVHDAFVLGYRMEFYMLYSVFEILFHNLRFATGERNPEEDYEAHINRFVQMLTKHGKITPELELLGETLQHMWNENRRLTRLSFSDSLTGLQNMRGFMTLARQMSYLALRNSRNVGIMMIDIDDFKRINDRYGHQRGNAILKAVADTIKGNLRRSDVVGRYGGEEFITFLFETDGFGNRCIAEKIRGSIEKQTPEGISLTVSIGAADGEIGPEVDKDLEGLIARADTCLYAAKRKGKNRVVCNELPFESSQAL